MFGGLPKGVIVKTCPPVGGGLKARKNGGQARFSVDQWCNWMSAMEQSVDRQCKRLPTSNATVQ
jgi:hypothetical protein